MLCVSQVFPTRDCILPTTLSGTFCLFFGKAGGVEGARATTHRMESSPATETVSLLVPVDHHGDAAHPRSRRPPLKAIGAGLTVRKRGGLDSLNLLFSRLLFPRFST